MAKFDPKSVRIKRTVYMVKYYDGTKLETIDASEIRKDKKKVVKSIEPKTVFYTCSFQQFMKVAKVEKYKQPVKQA